MDKINLELPEEYYKVSGFLQASTLILPTEEDLRVYLSVRLLLSPVHVRFRYQEALDGGRWSIREYFKSEALILLEDSKRPHNSKRGPFIRDRSLRLARISHSLD